MQHHCCSIGLRNCLVIAVCLSCVTHQWHMDINHGDNVFIPCNHHLEYIRILAVGYACAQLVLNIKKTRRDVLDDLRLRNPPGNSCNAHTTATMQRINLQIEAKPSHVNFQTSDDTYLHCLCYDDCPSYFAYVGRCPCKYPCAQVSITANIGMSKTASWLVIFASKKPILSCCCCVA